MCRNISIGTASLKTEAQRFPEPEVISFYFVSLGISFSQFLCDILDFNLLICWNSAYSWLCLLQLQGTVEASACCFYVSQQVLCTALWGKMKISHFSFLSESQDGALSPGQTVKDTSPQITKIFDSVHTLLWCAQLQGFLSGRGFAVLLSQLRWVLTQGCVMGDTGESSPGREGWQLLPELATLAFLSCAKATLRNPCRNPAEIGQGKIWTKLQLLTSALTATSHLTFSMQRSDG